MLAWTVLNSMVEDAHAGEFEFVSSISVQETYDDNIYLEEENEDDIITTLSPSLSLSYLTQRTNLRATYSPEVLFYSENSDEDEINHNASFDLDSRLTRGLRLSVEDRLVFTPAQEVTGSEVRVRSHPSDQTNNTLNATLFYRIVSPTTLRFGFGHSLVEYDMSELRDSHEYSSGFGVDHQLTGRDTLSLDYRYRKLFFEEENDTDIQSIIVGEVHQFPRELLLSVSGGIELIDEEDREEETGWSGNVHITKGFGTAHIGLAYNRQVSYGEETDDMSIIETVSLTGRKDFTRRFNGNFDCFLSAEESTRGDEVDNEDWGLTLGSTYHFTNRLNGNLACSYIYHNADGFTGGDTESYRARVEVTYLFRPWFRVFSSYSYYQQNALDPDEEDIENNLISAGVTITWL